MRLSYVLPGLTLFIRLALLADHLVIERDCSTVIRWIFSLCCGEWPGYSSGWHLISSSILVMSFGLSPISFQVHLKTFCGYIHTIINYECSTLLKKRKKEKGCDSILPRIWSYNYSWPANHKFTCSNNSEFPTISLIVSLQLEMVGCFLL